MGKIILRLDRMMVERKMSLNELAERVGISNVNLSKIKNNKVTAIRFSTLAAICEALNCDAGDIHRPKFEPLRQGIWHVLIRGFISRSTKKHSRQSEIYFHYKACNTCRPIHGLMSVKHHKINGLKPGIQIDKSASLRHIHHRVCPIFLRKEKNSLHR